MFLSWFYFRRYAITRPPIGVLNLWDVTIMIGGIVLVPYLYLGLPLWLVAGMITIGVLSALFFMWEPILRSRWAIWVATITLTGADIGIVLMFGATSTPYFIVNNAVLTMVIVGLTNLWAQSGMKARDVAILAGALAIYDVVATWQLPLTTDLFRRLADLPFAPLIAWQIGSGGLWLGIGIGDLLLATVFPLTMYKAFGRRSAIWALAISLSSIAAVLALPGIDIVHQTFPVMIVLGPLILLQYGYYRRKWGPERTTWQYLRAEPTGGPVAIEARR
jgi:hypothetical protein